MSPSDSRPGPSDATAALLEALESFFSRRAGAGDLVLVAFSGGPDSTALLWGLVRTAPGLGIALHAAHLDHGLDADSARRAAAARRLAARMGVPLTVERLEPAGAGSTGPEAFARHHRYAFLDRLADRLGARLVATAHHADDQAETVLLRMLFGSGLEGLGAMRRHGGRLSGRLVRPLLGLRRGELLRAVETSGLEPVEDPTNLDLGAPRNAVRWRLLPHLEAREPGTTRRLARLAAAARGAGDRIERRLAPLLDPRRIRAVPTGACRGAAIDGQAFEALPEPLRRPALNLLHRHAGAPYPAGAAARRELARQLAAGLRLGCDCGHGWRWESDAETLRLVKNASSPGEFAYNLSAPGSVDVAELDLRLHLARGRVAPWMFRGRAERAGLAADDLEGKRLLVRNRRPGDRIQPLGSRRRQRLKDLLIDRRVPRYERDRLPLLVVDDEIAWVPGVTIAERFRLGKDEESAWIARITSSLDPQ